MDSEEQYNQLLKKYEDLQIRVTQFSGVEQELINARDKLDQELELYKRLNDFNRSAIDDLSEVEFANVIVDSVIDILELESSLLFIYDQNNEENCLLISHNCSVNIPVKKVEFKTFLDQNQSNTRGNTVFFSENSKDVPMVDVPVNEGLFHYKLEQEFGIGIMLMCWSTIKNAPTYKKISPREVNVFSIFYQQVFSLFINRQKTFKIQEQLIEISKSELELKKLSLIATKTKNGVIISNNKGEIEWVNEAFIKITGYELDEVVGKKPKDFLQTEKTDSKQIALLSEGLANKNEVEVTIVNKTKDNNFYYNHLEIIPIFDSEGKHSNFIALQRDITQEVNSKEEILRINSRFEMIAQNAEIGIWEFNAQSGQVTWNDILYKQYGITEGETDDLRAFWLNSIHQDDRDQIEEKTNQVRSGESIKQEMNYRIVQKNSGQIRYLKTLVLAERNEIGELMRLVGSSTDQTDEVLYIKEIEVGKKKIEKINQNLERLVQEKSQRNLELAKTISDQEKLVTIGEIAAGIAHDLNTPIASIKIGTESLQSILEGLLKNTIQHCTSDQIQYAFDRSVAQSTELFIGGLQKRREMVELSNFLSKKHGSEPFEEDFLDNLVTCRFNAEHEKELDFILEASNREHFVKLINEIQMIHSFIDTIISSSERTSKVVEDIRNYIKKKSAEEKTTILLHSNIATVLNIFNYEIKRKAELIFDVNENIQISGYDVHLFQLWANLIKNAVESFETEHGGNYLKIFAEEKGELITVHIENNGPMIPSDIQKRIFEKFYTTKQSKNGTGLGLAIVKKIADEHKANLKLHSDTDFTRFTIEFERF